MNGHLDLGRLKELTPAFAGNRGQSEYDRRVIGREVVRNFERA